MANKRKPAVPDELLDQLLDGSDALEAFQSGELVQDLKKALAERILNAELDHHLDDEGEQSSGNHRNGHSRKRVLTDDGLRVLEGAQAHRRGAQGHLPGGERRCGPGGPGGF